VSPEQVAAFRLRRLRLIERAPAGSVVPVVGEMGGAQAQVLGAARSSLWARVEALEATDVDRALWEDRHLVRAWCMRRTLYLVPAAEVAVYAPGTARRRGKEVRWVRNRGIPGRAIGDWIDGLLGALDEPLTRSEIAERLGPALGVRIRWAVGGGGWGSRRKIPWLGSGRSSLPVAYLMHLAGARGVLCSGPNRGSEATFVRADAWIPGWRDRSVDDAELELLRTYLRAFGPATPGDFVAWTRILMFEARTTWERLGSELAEVEVDGRVAWVLRTDLRDLEREDAGELPVRLLPFFDSFLLGHLDRGHLLPPANVRDVYRNQGWVAPVVLVEGRVAGVWSASPAGRRLGVDVDLFGPTSRRLEAAIRREAEDLARFLGCGAAAVRIRSRRTRAPVSA